MQMRLAFLDQTDPPRSPSTTIPTATAWDRLDEASRLAALEILARLIARMIAAAPARETSDE